MSAVLNTYNASFIICAKIEMSLLNQESKQKLADAFYKILMIVFTYR